MRLLQVTGLKPEGDGKLELKEYFDDDTWSRNPHDEVLFNDIAGGAALQKKASQKLQYTATQALSDGYEHVWIDTCCIDKSSSAELQEAINSMYRWYQHSAVCYVYLEDVVLPSKRIVDDVPPAKPRKVDIEDTPALPKVTVEYAGSSKKTNIEKPPPGEQVEAKDTPSSEMVDYESDSPLMASVDDSAVSASPSTRYAPISEEEIRKHVTMAHKGDVAMSVKVNLQDTTIRNNIKRSRWFTRGWTLQELIAPRKRKFFSCEWVLLGEIGESKAQPESRALDSQSTFLTPDDMRVGPENPFIDLIREVSTIPAMYLTDGELVANASIALRMSWAANRRTTRREDMAYSLLGIFQVNMPLLYGEGHRAFLRLQEEIMRRSADATLFVWDQPRLRNSRSGTSLLAEEPFAFQNVDAANLEPQGWIEAPPFTMTSLGLQLRITLIPLDSQGDFHMGVLECSRVWDTQSDHRSALGRAKYAVYLRRLKPKTNLFARVFLQRLFLIQERLWPRLPQEKLNVFVPLDPLRYVDQAWAAANENYAEDITHVQIHLRTPRMRESFWTYWQHTKASWHQTYANFEQQMGAHRATFVSTRLPVAVCIGSPDYVGNDSSSYQRQREERPIWIVLSRSSHHITAAALQLNADPSKPRERYRISIEDVYGEPLPDSHELDSSSSSQMALGCKLSIRETDVFINDFKQRSQGYLHSKKISPWGTSLRHVKALSNVYAEGTLERAAKWGNKIYPDRDKMLDSLVGCTSIELLRRESALPDSWDAGVRLCRCCISLQPASEDRRDGQKTIRCAEVVA